MNFLEKSNLFSTKTVSVKSVLCLHVFEMSYRESHCIIRIKLLPITTATAPSASPRTNIRGVMSSFPAEMQNSLNSSKKEFLFFPFQQFKNISISENIFFYYF